MASSAHVVVVDDFVDLLDRLRLVLVRAGYEVSTYAKPSEFLLAPRPTPPCCLLLDLEMPEVSGLAIQQELLRGGDAVPTVFMTGHRDVPATIQAMKNGATDFLLKPFSNGDLLDAVARAVNRSVEQEAARQAVARARERLAALSPREREVCLLVAQGLTSREIAERLGTAESTISVHRVRIMAKLKADSVPDLVRLVDLAGSGPP